MENRIATDTESSIILDEEFRGLLPMLDDETFKQLEGSILQHGCRDPLVLWNGILIDGYNRYMICSHHDIPFNTVSMEFGSREEVLIWIISNQVSRRNLTPIQLSYYRGLHYNAEKKIQGTNNQFAQLSEKYQNDTFHSGPTASRLAEQYNVSQITIKRNASLAEAIAGIGEASPEAKRKILHGEVHISKSRLEALSRASEEEIGAVAAEIEEGTYEGRTPRSSQQVNADAAFESIIPEIRQLNAVISDFAKSFNSMFRQLSTGGSAEVKTVLRSYIDQLEEIYEGM